MGLTKSLALWERWRRSRRRGLNCAQRTLSPAIAGALPKGEPMDALVQPRGMGFVLCLCNTKAKLAKKQASMKTEQLMDLQIYEKDKFVEMDSMHDSIATNISIKDKTLIITYDNLNEGVMGRDGLPYYKNKRLTIEYVIDSYCDAKFFRKNKYKYVDLLEEKNKFYKLTNSCSFRSYKHAIDSFGEIILFFNIREKNKYFCFEISMDAEKVIYHWE